MSEDKADAHIWHTFDRYTHLGDHGFDFTDDAKINKTKKEKAGEEP